MKDPVSVDSELKPARRSWQPLAHLPANKTAVIGLVTSKFPKMEEQSYLESRMKEAAKFVAQGSGESEEQALQR